MVWSFGNLTVNVFAVKILFKQGALDKRKCPVQPESTRAVLLCLSRGGVRQSSNFLLLILDVALLVFPPLARSARSFFKSAFTYLREVASVNCATTFRSTTVAVAKLANAPSACSVKSSSLA
jgi:hypothetical protein